MANTTTFVYVVFTAAILVASVFSVAKSQVNTTPPLQGCSTPKVMSQETELYANSVTRVLNALLTDTHNTPDGNGNYDLHTTVESTGRVVYGHSHCTGQNIDNCKACLKVAFQYLIKNCISGTISGFSNLGSCSMTFDKNYV